MSKQAIDVAVIGAGMGGLTTAATLRRVGINVRVFEQASQFARLGAGIQQSPNAVKVLRELGLESRLRAAGFQPEMTQYREADTGRLLWERAQGKQAEDRFGAPHLLLHRGDLHEALASLLPPETIELGKKLVDYRQSADGVEMTFADGTRARADAMIAADGVHSLVRERMLGPEKPRYTGRVAYRTVFPASLLGETQIDSSTKWIGPDRHIVIYYINPRRDEVYFVTSTPEPEFDIESWSAIGDMNELRAAYAGFHPQVRAVLAACPSAHKWAVVERDPLPTWTQGRVALQGDACHPMTPYVAQGAASAIEDGAILSRCLAGAGVDDIEAALRRYEATRKPRTSRIQAMSSLNSVDTLKAEHAAMYGYDAWTAPLANPDATGVAAIGISA
jgi:6-hydroxynicotinate 3-monooxygenase